MSILACTRPMGTGRHYGKEQQSAMKPSKFARFLVAIVLVTLFAATTCTTAQQNASPKPLVFAQGADPRGLDPAYVDDGESAKILVNICDTLVRYAPESTELKPSLARDWSLDSSGTIWTFHLREDVVFHDGTKFNAEAVKFSVDRQLAPNRTSDMPYASFTFGPVDHVEVVDEYTVRFHLKEPYTPFLSNLAMAVAAPIVSPAAAAKYGDKLMQNPVGTGPFRFVRWDKGQQIVLERNASYWGDLPKITKLIFLFRRDESTRVSELLVGDSDIIDGISPAMVDVLKRSGMSIISSPGMNINYFGFICSGPPFDNPTVRKAITMAIQRDTLVGHLYRGIAQLANGPVPPFILENTSGTQPYKYNLEKAKELLTEAGLGHGFRFTILAYVNPRPYNPLGGERLATAIQADLRQLGIETDIRVIPWKDYRNAVFEAEPGTAFVYGWVGDNGDADNFLSLFESKEITSSLNKAKYSNSEVDALLQEGRLTTDPTRRQQIYSRIQEIIVEEAPWVFLSHSQVLVAHRPEVKDFVVHPTGVIFFKNARK